MRILACWLALILSSAAGAAGADEPRSREHQLKVAFLYSFTKFIEWPAASLGDARAPFVIGVMAQAPFVAEVERAMQDHKIKDREILVKTVHTAEEFVASHLVFVAASEDARFQEMQPVIGTRPVLSVGESPAFAQMGGTINFVVDNDRVRFEINMESAARAELRVSSQLQKLATVVRGKS